MRWIHFGIIILFAVATIIFALPKTRHRDNVTSRLQCTRTARAGGCHRLPSGRGDGRRDLFALIESIVRRFKANDGGFALRGRPFAPLTYQSRFLR